eukprot:gene23577-49564_t
MWIDAAWAKSREMAEEADRLWKEGKRDECKRLLQLGHIGWHPNVKVQAERKEVNKGAHELRHELESLDWANNEEMWEYVQANEHPEKERDGTWVDLHGLGGKFAVHKAQEFLHDAKEKGTKVVEVITGAGRPSWCGKGGPVVKRLVWTDAGSLLNRARGHRAQAPAQRRPRRLTFDDNHNAGSVNVTLRP